MKGRTIANQILTNGDFPMTQAGLKNVFGTVEKCRAFCDEKRWDLIKQGKGFVIARMDIRDSGTIVVKKSKR
jgi:hypothetical protein